MSSEKISEKEVAEVGDAKGDYLLEKEEIDSIVQGLGKNSNSAGLKALIQSKSVSYERLPMLEVVFDRLVRLLSTTLRNFTSDNVDVTLEEISSLRFKDYLDSIHPSSLISVVSLKEWGTSNLMVIDEDLIFTIVDVLLGGRREQPHKSENRVYTTIERTLTEDFVRVILDDLTHSFEPIEKVNFEFDRIETNPRFAMIERPANTGIIIRIKIMMDVRGGAFEYFIPYSAIEPVRDKLLQMFMGEKFGNDKIWENHLASEVWSTTIDAEAILDQVTTKLSEVMKWKKGSFLPLETYEGANVVIRSGDCVLYNGKVGNIRKRVAVQIEENFLAKETS